MFLPILQIQGKFFMLGWLFLQLDSSFWNSQQPPPGVIFEFQDYQKSLANTTLNFVLERDLSVL